MSAPPVVILCGGRGTRLQEHTQAIPKPLVEIGGMPIVRHVIELYAAQGFRRFLLATGYRGELIERYVTEHGWAEGVHVRCLQTGLETPTGGRIARVAESGALDGAERFCATYADGLADVDLQDLLAFHAAHGALATMTVVRPELQFGVTELDAHDRVTGFREKPRSEHWINGGFFCMQAGALDHIARDSVLERAPLEEMAAAGELRAYRHEGFWECMDTYKDAVALNDLWASGERPWARGVLVRGASARSATGAPGDAQAAGVDAQGAGVDAQAAGDAQRAGVDAQAAGVDAQRAGVDAQAAGVDAQRTGVAAQPAGMDAQRAGALRPAGVP